jgi:hypothetical protein
MDPNIRIAQELRLEHHHRDGSRSPMEPNDHDSADHDAERSWLRRTIFRCTACDEQVSVTTGGLDENGEPEGR